MSSVLIHCCMAGILIEVFLCCRACLSRLETPRRPRSSRMLRKTRCFLVSCCVAEKDNQAPVLAIALCQVCCMYMLSRITPDGSLFTTGVRTILISRVLILAGSQGDLRSVGSLIVPKGLVGTVLKPGLPFRNPGVHPRLAGDQASGSNSTPLRDASTQLTRDGRLEVYPDHQAHCQSQPARVDATGHMQDADQ